MWSRIYTKITTQPLFQKGVSFFKSLLGRVEKITPIEVYMVILVVASVVFATRYFQQESTSRLIRMQVTSQKWEVGADQDRTQTPLWLSQKLNLGLVERSLSGRIKAEVVEIESYDVDHDKSLTYLVVKLMADYNGKSQTYSFSGQPLLVGSSIELKLDGMLVPGQIIDSNYPRQGYDQGEFIVTLEAEYLKDWQVDNLEIGQKIINKATGQVVAELVDFEVSPSTSSKIFSLNQQLLIDEQKYQDVTVKLRVKAFKQDKDWFFAGQQRLRLGNRLNLFLDKVTLFDAEIIKIEYVE